MVYIQDKFSENLEQFPGNRLTVFYFYPLLTDDRYWRISEEKEADEMYLQHGDAAIMMTFSLVCSQV